MIPICIYRMRCNSSARVALFLFYNLHGSYHLLWRWLGVGMTTLVIVWSSLTSSYITEIELNCAIIMDVQKRCVDLIMPWWSPSSKDWLQEWRSGLCSSLYLNLFCPWLLSPEFLQMANMLFGGSWKYTEPNSEYGLGQTESL